MTQLYPLQMGDLRIRPTDDGWEFCDPKEGFAWVDIEIDISGPTQDNCEIVAVRWVADDPRGKKHYSELGGKQLQHAIAWLTEHKAEKIAHHIEVDYLPASIGAYTDQKRGESV